MGEKRIPEEQSLSNPLSVEKQDEESVRYNSSNRSDLNYLLSVNDRWAVGEEKRKDA